MHDTIIIGAGLSGLAAGIRLAYYERPVCIVEKHTTIGGLNSFYRLRKRDHDIGLHAVTNYAKPGTKTGPLSKLLCSPSIRSPRRCDRRTASDTACSSAVDVFTVADSDDFDGSLAVIDGVQDSVRADTHSRLFRAAKLAASLRSRVSLQLQEGFRDPIKDGRGETVHLLLGGSFDSQRIPEFAAHFLRPLK